MAKTVALDYLACGLDPEKSTLWCDTSTLDNVLEFLFFNRIGTECTCRMSLLGELEKCIHAYKLGIDLGGTNIVAGVVDENYKIIATGEIKTNCPRPAEEIIDDMAAAARTAIEKAGLKTEDIESMGVGTPGAIDPVNGIVCYANNLGFYDVPMAQMLKERLGVDFYIENDANAAAYGEYIAGAGKGTNNFVAVTLGTGVGGGVIILSRMMTITRRLTPATAALGISYLDVLIMSCFNPGEFVPIPYEMLVVIIFALAEHLSPSPRHTELPAV